MIIDFVFELKAILNSQGQIIYVVLLWVQGVVNEYNTLTLGEYYLLKCLVNEIELIPH